MKKVISENELREVMGKSVNLICDAVSSTLGPSGNNVLIDSGDASPFITNDGVTIALSISSDDKRCNAILEIIKEATLKTNEVVGDGTTTTLVLLQSIFNNGVKKIESGINPIILKKELDNSLNEIVLKLKKMSKKPTKKDYISIASISSNDKDIGVFLENVYSIMGSIHAIKLSEGSEETYYEIKKGYSIDVDVPNIYFDDKKEINLDNTYILLLKGYLNDLEAISDIINEGLNRNKNIVILADDYDNNRCKELYSSCEELKEGDCGNEQLVSIDRSNKCVWNTQSKSCEKQKKVCSDYKAGEGSALCNSYTTEYPNYQTCVYTGGNVEKCEERYYSCDYYNSAVTDKKKEKKKNVKKV